MRQADDVLCGAEEDAAADLLDNAGIQSLRSLHAVCRQAVQDRVAAPTSARRQTPSPTPAGAPPPRPRPKNCRSSARDRGGALFVKEFDDHVNNVIAGAAAMDRRFTPF